MAKVTLFRSPDSAEFDDFLGDEIARAFPKDARVALKLHMGEGEKHHFDCGLAARCVSLLKNAGMKPFLFDTPVMYPGERHTPEDYLKRAALNGFSEKVMGCPVVVSDDARPVEGKFFPVGVSTDLTESDGVLVLSHVKGHPCSGIGGALKNLGMGGVDRKTKGLLHGGAKPVLTGECDGCGSCVEGCPGSALEVSNDKIQIDQGSCWGCDRCIDVCPRDALESQLASFGALLIDGAAAVASQLHHAFYVNDVRKITRLCDCCRDAGPEIAPDVGVLVGADPVAIDQASVDLAVRAAGEDIFSRELGRNPWEHIREAADRGMGTLEYEVREL